MNSYAALPVTRFSLALVSIRTQTSLPEPEPLTPPRPPPLPPDGVPPPLDMPPQTPPEIREPYQPGEHLPIGDKPPLPTPARH